jgi:hypothetical protein
MSSAVAIVQPRPPVTTNSQISGWYSCNSAQRYVHNPYNWKEFLLTYK